MRTHTSLFKGHNSAHCRLEAVARLCGGAESEEGGGGAKAAELGLIHSRSPVPGPGRVAGSRQSSQELCQVFVIVEQTDLQP